MYKEFWELFAKGYGGLRMASVIMVITIGVSLLEGFNMGLLLPLLESLESPEQGGGHWVSNAFARVFGALGLPMELKTILVALAVLVLVVAALKYLRTILATKTNVGFAVWMRSKIMGNFSFRREFLA